MKNHAFFQVHICAQLNTPTLTLTVTAPPSRRYDTLMLTKGQLNIRQGAEIFVIHEVNFSSKILSHKHNLHIKKIRSNISALR